MITHLMRYVLLLSSLCLLQFRMVGSSFSSGGNAPKAGAPPSSYDKPWRKGMVSDAPPAQGGRQNPGGANGQPADKKKYNGPDPDLAVQLERDMVRERLRAN